MAKMTEEEKHKFFKATGLSVKDKCDNPSCSKPIVGCLTYNGTNGRGQFCSRECLAAVEGPSGVKHKKEKQSVPDEDDDVKKKKKSSEDDEEEPKKKKKKVKSSDEDDEPKKKKKKAAASDEDDDDEPKKKKKKSSDDDEDEEPKKKKVAKSGNPFRDGSIIAEAFDLCVAGTTRKKLNRFCEEKEVGATRIFSCMKAEAYGDSKWKYSEDESGTISISLKKAAKA